MNATNPEVLYAVWGADHQVTFQWERPSAAVEWSASAVQGAGGDFRGIREPQPVNRVVFVRVAAADPPGLARTDTAKWQPTNPSERLSIQLVKSNMQKAIRRNLSPAAVASAAYLLWADSLAFLRRLPVLCLEDVAAHQSLPQVVWLMGATELGYGLLQSEALMLVQVVADICAWPNRLKLTPRVGGLEENKQLRWACITRAAYGGMAGDIARFQRVAGGRSDSGQWLAPHIGHVVPLGSGAPVSMQQLEAGQTLAAEHRLTIAADFHCTDVVDQLAELMGAEAEAPEIMSAIWAFRSAPNIRDGPIGEFVVSDPPPEDNSQAAIRSGVVPRWWPHAEAMLEPLCEASWNKSNRKLTAVASPTNRFSQNKLPGSMCLTLHQPAASLLVHGLSRLVGVNFMSDCCSTLWIHASGRAPTLEQIRNAQSEISRIHPSTNLQFPQSYPTNALLGCIEVSHWVPAIEFSQTLLPRADPSVAVEAELLASTASVVVASDASRLLLAFSLDMSVEVNARGLKAEMHSMLWALNKPTVSRAEKGLQKHTLQLQVSWSSSSAAAAPDQAQLVKRQKGLQKKLRQVAELVQKQADGVQLQINQLTKIESQAEMEAELSEVLQLLATM